MFILIVWKTSDKKWLCIKFSSIYVCLDFHYKSVFHNNKISTFLSQMVTPWKPRKNKNLKLSTLSAWTVKRLPHNRRISLSLTSKILGSYMWAFTLLSTWYQDLKRHEETLTTTSRKRKLSWQGMWNLRTGGGTANCLRKRVCIKRLIPLDVGKLQNI